MRTESHFRDNLTLQHLPPSFQGVTGDSRYASKSPHKQPPLSMDAFEGLPSNMPEFAAGVCLVFKAVFCFCNNKVIYK